MRARRDRALPSLPARQTAWASAVVVCILGAACFALACGGKDSQIAYRMPGDPAVLGWSKPDTDEGDFRCAARICLDRSAEARARAEKPLRSDAAYRSFRACMEDIGWTHPRAGAEERFLSNVPKWSELEDCRAD